MLLVEGLSARSEGGGGPLPCWCEKKDPYERALLNKWRTPINGFPRVNGWGRGRLRSLARVTNKKRLPLTQGVRNRAHWLS